jgi:hypothetical protein
MYRLSADSGLKCVTCCPIVGAIQDHLQHHVSKQSDLDLTEFPDVTLEGCAGRICQHECGRRQLGASAALWFGSREEYESAGMKMGYLSIPFTYADHPAMGPNSTHCVLHVHNRDVLHMRCRQPEINQRYVEPHQTARPAMLSRCDALRK